MKIKNQKIIIEKKEQLDPADFIRVLKESSLAERRPVDRHDVMEKMAANANLIVTASVNGEIIGIARSVTDFAYCCYLSDLAVCVDWQKQGIGKKLINETAKHLPSGCKIILLAAPGAAGYYPKIGFGQHNSAWILDNK
jgi:predicted N-acetyltransferase YhbS